MTVFASVVIVVDQSWVTVRLGDVVMAIVASNMCGKFGIKRPANHHDPTLHNRSTFCLKSNFTI